jgi:phage/plasmid-like protein (TIGR03299 family)
MAEAMDLAGMGWTVLSRNFQELSPQIPDGFLADRQIPDSVEGWKMLLRSDNGRLLHVCRESWTPLQNKDAFAWFDPIIQDGDATISAAVSLKEGRRIAITVKLRDSNLEVVPGDTVEPYLLLFNSHDGTLSVGVKPTFIRTVCHNTLSANLVGIRKGDLFDKGGDIEISSKFVKIRHTAGMIHNLERTRDLFNVVTRKFEKDVEQYRLMAGVNLTTGEFEKYVAKVFKVEADAVDGITNTRRWEPILQNFEQGVGSDIPGVGKTIWGAVNAITEWTSHQRGGSEDDVDATRKRLESLWFADGDRINSRANELALDLISAK